MAPNVTPVRRIVVGFALASRSTSTRPLDAADDPGVGVLGGHAYVDPSQLRHRFVAPDVSSDLSRGLPVMLALVVDAHHDLAPAHVELRDELAEFVVHG